MMKPNRKPYTSDYNPYALLHWLMQQERTIGEIAEQTGVVPRQVRRILNQIDASGIWHVEQRRIGRQKLFWVERPGPTQRLIRRTDTPQLVSASEYAALCGVDRTSIRDRIKHGSLVAERRKSISGRVTVLVDVARYPPYRKR